MKESKNKLKNKAKLTAASLVVVTALAPFVVLAQQGTTTASSTENTTTITTVYGTSTVTTTSTTTSGTTTPQSFATSTDLFILRGRTIGLMMQLVGLINLRASQLTTDPGVTNSLRALSLATINLAQSYVSVLRSQVERI